MTIINLSQEPHQIPTLAKWHQAEWIDLNPGQTLEHRIERMQAYLGNKLIPSTFIYKHESQLAGSAAIIENDMDTRPELTPWLASVYVAPEFRRQGIGAKLVKHVMLQAKTAGVVKLYLFTPDQADFYAKLGWTAIAEEYYRDHRVTIMSVSLNDPKV
ncbi:MULTISPECIES: GNAT family N-acetyltransferase [Methylomonas]|uniref:GCN5 family acetyltransferase n=2 Tax=Methylomonas TaxID=416 RepID=A0A140E6Z1_9GAMM|nr:MULTISPECIES: GNAT family N-acetyltransferase [Methylomonas]AMK79165.1 GCN5 family acetyltransferase [Methylomonas denitrificans]OAH99669.1 GCN5 family acetyltransferase [Methylomonas methanica]TCV78155.1 acetyltransferase (GNAT) family protein [Methylomonas methanica]